MKALVLAAGFGTRLKPFTNKIPKPLCPFFGAALMDYGIFRVQSAGLDFAVNTHFHSEQVTSHLNRWYPDNFFLSHEESIRGTGGAVFPLKKWLDGSPLLIYNADIVSDIDTSLLINYHLATKALATMVLLKDPSTDKTPIFYTDDRVVQIGDSGIGALNHSTFSGVHILSPEFIDAIPSDCPWSIIDTYKDFLSLGCHINAYIHGGFWADLGTPLDLWKAHVDVLASAEPEELSSRIGVPAIRARQGLSRLKYDHTNQSCLSIDQAYSKAPKQSFVDLASGQTIHQSIDQSVVVANHIDSKQDISRQLIFYGMEKRF